MPIFERHRSREAPWLETIGYGAESRRKVCHPFDDCKTLSTKQYIDTFFESGKNEAAKGEEWASPFISCALDTVGM